MNTFGAGRTKTRFFNRTMCSVAFCALALFTLTVSLHAQVSATIAGTVTDQTGAVVPEAEVTLINQATQFTRAVKSNASGD